MKPAQSGVHAGSVIAAVAQEDLHRLGDLVEQGLDLRGVIDVAVGQDGGDDPAGHRVEADVQLAPRAPLAGAVFLDQPFARAAQLQPGTVDQQVDRSASRAGLRRQLQAPGPPAEGGEIWHRQVEAEQLEDRADQPLGLAQRQVEHRAQCQSGRDCQVRVVRLTARRGAAFQAAIASSVNHTVRLPRCRSASLYSDQFVTRRFDRGIWWRWSALYLCGMKARSGASKQIASYAIRHIRATRCNKAENYGTSGFCLIGMSSRMGTVWRSI